MPRIGDGDVVGVASGDGKGFSSEVEVGGSLFGPAYRVVNVFKRIHLFHCNLGSR